jgi:hypothetical protein
MGGRLNASSTSNTSDAAAALAAAAAAAAAANKPLPANKPLLQVRVLPPPLLVCACVSGPTPPCTRAAAQQPRTLRRTALTGP